jgi:hypothetical protein
LDADADADGEVERWRCGRLLVGAASGDRVSTSRYPLVSALSLLWVAPLRTRTCSRHANKPVRHGGASKMKLCDRGRRYPHPGLQPVHNRAHTLRSRAGLRGADPSWADHQ